MLVKETEGFGVTYDRFVLSKLHNQITKKCGIRSVLEMPSYGIKACPSIYSVNFAKNKINTTITDYSEPIEKIYKQLGIENYIKISSQNNYCSTKFKPSSFDLVWNFVSFAYEKDVPGLLKEMYRVSKRYILLVSCNNLQIGYPWHRILHGIYKIPWNHGNTKYSYFWNVKDLLKKTGFSVIDWGAIDTPPWPDPVGFRDIRLHKNGAETSLDNVEWDVPYINYLEKDRFPFWMKFLGNVDFALRKGMKKLPFSHLFYFLASK